MEFTDAMEASVAGGIIIALTTPIILAGAARFALCWAVSALGTIWVAALVNCCWQVGTQLSGAGRWSS